jgi:hypothetical protein
MLYIHVAANLCLGVLLLLLQKQMLKLLLVQVSSSRFSF